MTIARDHGFEVRVDELSRSDLYVAEEMFVCGTAAEVSAVNSVDDRAIPCPGPMTQVIAAEYARAVRGQDRQVQGVVRSSYELRTRQRRDRDLRHDAARRVAARGHLAHRRGQAADRGAARLARRPLHRGGLAGREPEGRRAVPARAEGAEARDVDARCVRLDPAGQGQGRQRRHVAPSRRGERGTVCIVGKCVGLPRHRSARHHARRRRGDGRRLGGVPPRQRACDVLFDAEHFFDGYKRNSEFSLRVLEAAVTERCESSRAVRHQRRRAAARGRSRSSPTSCATSAAT